MFSRCWYAMFKGSIANLLTSRPTTLRTNNFLISTAAVAWLVIDLARTMAYWTKNCLTPVTTRTTGHKTLLTVGR